MAEVIQKIAKFLSMHVSNIKLANSMHILLVTFDLDLISKYTVLTAYWCVTFSLSKLRESTIQGNYLPEYFTSLFVVIVSDEYVNDIFKLLVYESNAITLEKRIDIRSCNNKTWGGGSGIVLIYTLDD